jgi:hypothetical protein
MKRHVKSCSRKKKLQALVLGGHRRHLTSAGFVEASAPLGGGAATVPCSWFEFISKHTQ